MNARTLIAAAALAAASLPGFAASSLTRGEVRAEMEQLRAAHALPMMGEASPSQLEANTIDQRVAALQKADEYDEVAPESLMFVTPTGTIVIIETLPGGEDEAARDAEGL